jgi:hypothetical protein
VRGDTASGRDIKRIASSLTRLFEVEARKTNSPFALSEWVSIFYKKDRGYNRKPHIPCVGLGCGSVHLAGLLWGILLPPFIPQEGRLNHGCRHTLRPLTRAHACVRGQSLGRNWVLAFDKDPRRGRVCLRVDRCPITTPSLSVAVGGRAGGVFSPLALSLTANLDGDKRGGSYFPARGEIL